MKRSIFFYKTSIGRIGIAENGDAVTNLYFESETIPRDVSVRETPLLRNAADQLLQYLSGKRKIFTLPLAPAGTEFTQRVYESLQVIPYGETRAYLDVARSAGNSRASQAAGRACSRNPVPLFIPCHRAIGSDGSLKGYKGGIPAKAFLLNLERDSGHSAGKNEGS
jgi:methylated-DNA-[protein]-cysteine S-methyltransferase